MLQPLDSAAAIAAAERLWGAFVLSFDSPGVSWALRIQRGIAMLRSVIGAAAIAALCSASVTPALAQDYRPQGFDAPRGATASLNFRIPLGGKAERQKPSYGLTLGYGHVTGSPALDGRTATRAVRLADIRFSGPWTLEKAELATFDLVNLEQDRRMNMVGGKKSWLWIGLLIAAGVVICVAADCFEDDDSEDEDSPGTPAS